MGNRQYDAECIKWMNENPAPCVKCRERNATCHASCERFNDWNNKKAEARKTFEVRSKPYLTAYETEQRLRKRGRKKAKER